MKYMGSKRAMLQNGLGAALDAAMPNAVRFVDLFTGSGAVAHNIARRFAVPVLANDLQGFAASLAGAVVERTCATGVERWARPWLARGLVHTLGSPLYGRASAIQNRLAADQVDTLAVEARALCAEAPDGTITKAYGGFYFSPLQSLLLDALRCSLPHGRSRSKVALAALIAAASKTAASPGHTAQPFKANATAGPYLIAAWSIDLTSCLLQTLSAIDAQHALIAGKAAVRDAAAAAVDLKEGDLAFVDPPYSSVHYSRFYHVLETIARGTVGPVAGSGRYPDITDRPSSDYSFTTRAEAALSDLFAKIGNSGSSAIVTFPAGAASNGLSGDIVKELADVYFNIVEAKVTSRFSTLGGDRKHRAARQDAAELILTLTPR